MTQENESFTVNLNQDVMSVLNAAGGAALTNDELAEIATGEVFAPPVPLCIGSIGYRGTGGKITFVQFTNGFNLNSTNAVNLSDFSGRFEDAANFGHGIRVILNTAVKRIVYLVIVPCECPCERENNF